MGVGGDGGRVVAAQAFQVRLAGVGLKEEVPVTYCATLEKQHFSYSLDAIYDWAPQLVV